MTDQDPSEIDEPGWKGLRAYTRNVAIPVAIAEEIIARGEIKETGVHIPEVAFEPGVIFKALEKRRIYVHETVSEL